MRFCTFRTCTWCSAAAAGAGVRTFRKPPLQADFRNGFGGPSEPGRSALYCELFVFARFNWPGSGPSRGDIDQMIGRRRLNGSVEFPGWASLCQTQNLSVRYPRGLFRPGPPGPPLAHVGAGAGDSRGRVIQAYSRENRRVPIAQRGVELAWSTSAFAFGHDQKWAGNRRPVGRGETSAQETGERNLPNGRRRRKAFRVAAMCGRPCFPPREKSFGTPGTGPGGGRGPGV